MSLELINKLYKQILEEQKPEITSKEFDEIFTELQIWDSQYPNYADADLPAKIKTIALYSSKNHKDEKTNKLLASAAIINSNDFELWLNLGKQRISDSGKCDLWSIFLGAFYLRMACLIQGAEKKYSNELSPLLTEKMVSLQWKKLSGENLGPNIIEVAQYYGLNTDPIYFHTAFYLCYLSRENGVATDEVQDDYLPLNLGMLFTSKLELRINLTRVNNYFIDVIKNRMATTEKNSEVKNYINTYFQRLQTINKQYLTFVRAVVENKTDGKITDNDLQLIFSETILPLIWEYNRLYGKERSLSAAYQNLIVIQQILEINKIKNPLLSGMIDYQIGVCCMEGIGTIKDIHTAVKRFTASFKVAVELKDPSTQYLCLNALKKIAENCEIPVHKIVAKLALADCYKTIAADQDHPFKVRDLAQAQELYQEIQKSEHLQWVNDEQRETIQKCQTEVAKKIENLKTLATAEQAKLFFYRGRSAANSNDVPKAKKYLEQSFNLGLMDAGLEYAQTCIDKENPSNFEEAFFYLNETVNKSINMYPMHKAALIALEIATKYSNTGYSDQVSVMKEQIINYVLYHPNPDLERTLNTVINRTYQFKGDKSYDTITLTEEKFLNQFRFKALQLLPKERNKNTNQRIADLINKLVSSINFVSEDITLVLALMTSKDLFSVTSIDQFFKNVFILLEKLPNLIIADDQNLLNIKTQINNLISHLFAYINERLRVKESSPSITELASLFKLLAENQDYIPQAILVSWLLSNSNHLEIIIVNNITKQETTTVLDALESIGSKKNIEFVKVFASYYKTMQQKQKDYASKKQLYDETKKGNKTSFSKLEESTDELSKTFFYKYVRELDQDKSGKIYNHYTLGFTKPNPEKKIFPDLKDFAEKGVSAATMWEVAECYRTKYSKKNGNNEDEALWWSFRAGFADVLNGEHYKLAEAEFEKPSPPQGRLFFYLLTGRKPKEMTDDNFNDLVENNAGLIIPLLKKIKETIIDSPEIHELKKLKLCERILALNVNSQDLIANIRIQHDKLSVLFTIPYGDFSSLITLQNQISVPRDISQNQKLAEPQNPAPSAPSAPPLKEATHVQSQATTTPQNQPAQEQLQPNQNQTAAQSSPKNDSAKEAIKEEAVATSANQDKELLEENNQLTEQNKILNAENRTLKDELQILKAQMQQLQQNFLTLQQQVDAQKTVPVSSQTTLTVSRETTAQMGSYIKQTVKQAVAETLPKKIKITPLLEQQGAFKKKKMTKKLEVSTKDTTQGTVCVFTPKSPFSVKSPPHKNR